MKKSGWISEFKTFIMRGNVLDMAVGVVIGSAFTAIVTSVVENLLTPIIALILGKTDFSGITVGPFGIGAVINAIITSRASFLRWVLLVLAYTSVTMLACA